MDKTLTYLYPAWGLIPTLDQMKKFHAVHVRVAFADEATAPVEIVHNLQLAYGPPLQEPEWVDPLVVINAVAASSAAPVPIVTVKDGNTIVLNRAAGGPNTAATYDVWIIRPPWLEKRGIFG